MKTEETSYLLARLPIGFSFLGHGVVRLPKLTTFAEGMTKSFSETFLPELLVMPFAYAIPIVELILGITILIGFRMKESAIAGVLLMCLLIMGCAVQENWSAIAIQLFYGLYLSILYYFANYNKMIFAS